MFKKYTSIENTYREEFLDRIKGHFFGKDEFVVQEKAHGSNLSYWTRNGEDFHAAKRTGPLTEDEKFYNFQLILSEIKPQLQHIWNDLKQEIPDLEQLTFFGEVIGGTYPHPEVAKDKAAIRVQKGVFYSPKNHFFAFDLMINADRYLDIDVANNYFEKYQLLHAKTIFRGSIEDCLNYPNEFQSRIPNELGLPEIVPNIVEGVVIKPAKTRYFNNGTRVVLKNKNQKWSEKEKFGKRIKVEEPLPEKVVKLQEAILTYVTENRLNNVLSKIGEVTQKDFGKVLGMFNKDVVEDFLKDYHEIMDELEKKEAKSVTKSYQKVAAELVRKNM